MNLRMTNGTTMIGQTSGAMTKTLKNGKKATYLFYLVDV